MLTSLGYLRLSEGKKMIVAKSEHYISLFVNDNIKWSKSNLLLIG